MIRKALITIIPIILLILGHINIGNAEEGSYSFKISNTTDKAFIVTFKFEDYEHDPVTIRPGGPYTFESASCLTKIKACLYGDKKKEGPCIERKFKKHGCRKNYFTIAHGKNGTKKYKIIDKK